MEDKNAHIPTEEIKNDILETELEIDKMRKESAAFRILGDRWSIMRADHRDKNRIPEELAFIEKLKGILKLRGEL